jgi:hypothetical protein
MSSDSHYLAAFTPSDRGESYHFYPPFINFTQIGDRVRIIVRARDRQIEGKPDGWYEPISAAQMDMPVKDFKELLENALGKLLVDR